MHHNTSNLWFTIEATQLTAYVLHFCLCVTSRPMKWNGGPFDSQLPTSYNSQKDLDKCQKNQELGASGLLCLVRNAVLRIVLGFWICFFFLLGVSLAFCAFCLSFRGIWGSGKGRQSLVFLQFRLFLHRGQGKNGQETPTPAPRSPPIDHMRWTGMAKQALTPFPVGLLRLGSTDGKPEAEEGMDLRGSDSAGKHASNRERKTPKEKENGGSDRYKV